MTSLKYNGTEAKVVSEVVVVKDANGDPVMITDPGHPESGETIPATEIKYKIVNAVSPNTNLLIDDEGVETYFDSEDAAMKEIEGTIIGGYGATAFGLYSEAKGAHSTAFGVRTTAGGIGATAWGNGTQATGDYSTAFGAVGVNSSSGADSAVNTNTEAQADYSVAVLGGITRKQDDINAINSVALGGAYDASRPDSDYFKPSLTNAPYSIALLGGETASTATNSLAVGLGSVAIGTNSIAIGRGGKDIRWHWAVRHMGRKESLSAV